MYDQDIFIPSYAFLIKEVLVQFSGDNVLFQEMYHKYPFCFRNHTYKLFHFVKGCVFQWSIQSRLQFHSGFAVVKLALVCIANLPFYFVDLAVCKLFSASSSLQAVQNSLCCQKGCGYKYSGCDFPPNCAFLCDPGRSWKPKKSAAHFYSLMLQIGMAQGSL